MLSLPRGVLTLLPDPLSNVPQSLNREQRGITREDIGGRRSVVVRPARGDGAMIAIRQADDKIRVSPTTDANDLDALPNEGMMRVRHRDVFRSMAVEGGSLL
jgi:hypothetical protein